MTKTILVNKDNKIKDSYLNKIDLVETKDIEENPVFVEKETYEHYLLLKDFLKEKNVIIGIASAYRSIENQIEVYNDFVDKYGRDYASNVVAVPYTSEHHTGLAIDIEIQVDNKFPNDNNLIMKQVSKYEEIHKYLKDFGFILRYPKDKENITGYPYEPWHIRYVGNFVSNIIMNNNLTLEEYLNEYSGVIPVYKEKGVTSFDVVHEISKLFGIKRVGHTGTLDPLAEGVLLICIGKATKIVELLTCNEKEYIAEVKLGVKTDTLDIEGKVLEEKIIPNNLNIEEVINSYNNKTYNQEVPIYSAIKVKGKKLYDYARKNIEVELPKKEVTIKQIELLTTNKDTFTFKTLVSKGTYIRSLIRDICYDLNTVGIMTNLTRTKQGKVELKDCYKLEDIKNNNYKIKSIEEVLNYPSFEVNKEQSILIKNGVPIDNIYNIKDKVIFKYNNKLLGISEVKNNKLVTWKNF